ncbi:hypothetical protein BJF83_20710 [Nocardiopsis sp. CNR-923]|uniref:hypothetical protein n=1 Tax=Nocardiopsis sp. CNR-923 TaxID=1904965 RepID=UPI0009650124|nr:hypothetical protein [Nocardiopsis sp. CNR-923]OLT26587.1 hypothetical protein BJF83_20710 [Nocardiopsis sp. CNR-923]
MSHACGQKVAYSTLNTALNGDRLPKLHIVEAFIEGCGGSHDDVRRWATAWRKLRKQEAADSESSRAVPNFAAQVFEMINYAHQQQSSSA